MPRAEVGSTKHLANKMKSKGLQRLRWYCQVCEKQCRDENGFKCHTQSESHVRAMQAVGSNARAAISDYSGQFLGDFVRQLRTAHGTKAVHINKFYQEYIADKEHVHMNATRWPSLTEFAKHLGREGICRVEENERGLQVAWIDNSPAALRRQAAIQKRERQDKGDEELEQQLIRQQIARAQAEAGVGGEDGAVQGAGDAKDQADSESRQLKRADGERITLSFGAPKTNGSASPPKASDGASDTAPSSSGEKDMPSQSVSAPAAAPKVAIGLSTSSQSAPKPKNVFAAAASKKKVAAASNPLAGGTKKPVETTKKMSEAERIMREELQRKRPFASAGGGVGFGLGLAAPAGGKKQRVG